MADWGATLDELACSHCGDEPLPGPVADTTTCGVDVHAPPEAVWRWIVQIGQGRGGMYSYEWLENLFGLDIHNARDIREKWQHLAVGDQVRVVPCGKLGMPEVYAFRVAVVDPPHALVLRQQPPEHPWDATWAFLVIPSGVDTCRFCRGAAAPKRLG